MKGKEKEVSGGREEEGGRTFQSTKAKR